MKLVYIAGPYRADSRTGIDLNIARARGRALDLVERSFAELNGEWYPLVPHTNAEHFDAALVEVEQAHRQRCQDHGDENPGQTLERFEREDQHQAAGADGEDGGFDSLEMRMRGGEDELETLRRRHRGRAERA